MKRLLGKTAVILLCSLLAFWLVGCANENEYIEPMQPATADAPPQPIERDDYCMRLSFNTLYLMPGGEERVVCTVYDGDNSPTGDCRIVYTVTEGTAQVTDDGLIIAPVAGESSISVAAYDDGGNVVASAGISVDATEDADFYGGATYIGGVLLVNKEFSIPESYDPGGLLPETREAADKMIAAASAEGHTLWIQSGYRSYSYQLALYSMYVRQDGQAAADRYSARPGYSEHQTGMTFDLNSITEAFGYTPGGQWVAEHAHEYGFIIRYPKDMEWLTGYTWEPWHLRYLGVETATAVYESGLTLEEYLGVKTIFTYW